MGTGNKLDPTKIEISDISIEEEDIGNVVQRIYESKLSYSGEKNYELKEVMNK